MNSSREMKRANFMSDKNNRRFKISILDNKSYFKDNENKFKTDTDLYFFSYKSNKNRKNINEIDIKK